jgi:hypothetical protein
MKEDSLNEMEMKENMNLDGGLEMKENMNS